MRKKAKIRKQEQPAVRAMSAVEVTLTDHGETLVLALEGNNGESLTVALPEAATTDLIGRLTTAHMEAAWLRATKGTSLDPTVR